MVRLGTSLAWLAALITRVSVDQGAAASKPRRHTDGSVTYPFPFVFEPAS